MSTEPSLVPGRDKRVRAQGTETGTGFSSFLSSAQQSSGPTELVAWGCPGTVDSHRASRRHEGLRRAPPSAGEFPCLILPFRPGCAVWLCASLRDCGCETVCVRACVCFGSG